jgi:hypothetical protein
MAGEAAPRHRAPPRTLRGLGPCDPEKLSYENERRRFVSLPLVGTESYRLIGCMFPIRVTFLADPTETDPGYIVK